MSDILTKRQITHEEAYDCLRRFCGSHFRDGRDVARIGIPARPDYDDDLVLSAYIQQQLERDKDLALADSLIATHAFTIDRNPRDQWPAGSLLEASLRRHEARLASCHGSAER